MRLEALGLPSLCTYFFIIGIHSGTSNAYFGLTGTNEIPVKEDIDEEAALWINDKRDDVHLWNENGYYTAPSKSYERIDLSPEPDDEETTGYRTKKNVGPKQPEVSLGDMEQPQANYPHRQGFLNNPYLHMGSEARRTSQSFHYRRHAESHPGQRRAPHPQYRQDPYSVQQFWDSQIQRVHRDHMGQFRNGNVLKMNPQNSDKAHTETLNPISAPFPQTSIKHPGERTAYDDPRIQLEVSRGPSDSGSHVARSTGSNRYHGSPNLGGRNEDAIEVENSNANHFENSKFPLEDSSNPPEINPGFVTKDISSIMDMMTVDSNGQMKLKDKTLRSQSSLPTTERNSGEQSESNELNLMLVTDINKKRSRQDCDELNLTRKQRKICKKDVGLPQILREAMLMSVAECQYQFRFERWNCTTGRTRVHLLSKGNKETAFLFAISSAGLAHSVARGCAKGYLERCSCDEEYSDYMNQEAWMWGGCGDNVHESAKFVRQFLRPKFRNRDIRAEVDKHNSDLGIRMVRQSVRKTCKCHGVSGSCTTKTCWRKVSPFYEIGKRIKNAYNKSVKVGGINSTGKKPKLVRRKRTRRNRPEITTEATKIRDGDVKGGSSNHEMEETVNDRMRNSSATFDINPRNNELVYLEKSPPYCKRTRYSPGTKGRLCDKQKNCDKICCGRGYTSRHRIVHRSCECEVRWCCYVECKTCLEKKEVHTCN